MKKTVYVISMIALAGVLAACNKDNTVAEKTPLTIRASIEENAVASDTKTTFDTDDNSLQWTAGDKIYVFAPKKEELRGASSTTRYNQFNINVIAAGGKSATFTAAESKDWSNAGDAVAFYGQLWDSSYGFRTRDGGSSSNFPVFTIPRSQSYNAGNPNTKLLLMISNKFTITGTNYTPLDNLKFTHKTSIIKIPVKNTGTAATLKSISVTAASTSLIGEMYGYGVKTSDYTGMSIGWGFVVGEESKDANKTVTMTGINTAMTSTAKNYYLVVWPGAHGALTVTLTDSGDETKTFTYTAGLTSVAGKVYKFPVIDWASK